MVAILVPPILQSNPATTEMVIGILVREGKPTKIALNLSTYTGAHTMLRHLLLNCCH